MNPFKELWKALRPLPLEERRFIERWNNLTPRARQAITFARKEAARFHHDFIGTEHILLGLVQLGQGVATNVLARMRVDLKALRAEVEKQVPAGTIQKPLDSIPFTPRMKNVLAIAATEARGLKHSYIGTEHLLLGLLREDEGVAGRVLRSLGVDVEATRREILKELTPVDSPDDEPAA
jgi:ATP-dependent Clp protease ATP-binding subunit ClpC